jgi:hypothetical protein
MVYNNNFLLWKGMTVNQEYYFAVEAFNENGISGKSKVVKVN